MYQNQFLLTKERFVLDNWQTADIGDYRLMVHPKMDFHKKISKESEVYLIGDVFCWDAPDMTNEQILSTRLFSQNFDRLLENSNDLCGNYLLIFKSNEEFKLFHDCGGQYEVFYSSDFTSIGSQPKIIGESLKLIPHADKEADDFYHSEVFAKKKLFLNETSQWQNVKHLLPNHLLDIRGAKADRFFPNEPIVEKSVADVAEKVSAMLKGFIKAISLRNKVAIGVTGGFDSRLLFLGSLDIEAKYYVLKDPKNSNSHPDVQLPSELTRHYNKEFEIVEDQEVSLENLDPDYQNSVDFERSPSFSLRCFEGMDLINGGISEVGRNCYGYFNDLNGSDLSYLLGYGEVPFAIKEYEKWLANGQLFSKMGVNFLDMLYWEDRVGIWGAKASTEAYALGKRVFVPFNCRNLIVEMISTKRKHRDYHLSRLHKKLTEIMSEGDPFVTGLGYFSGNNPMKLRVIIALKKTGLYNLYRNYAMKKRKLRLS